MTDNRIRYIRIGVRVLQPSRLAFLRILSGAEGRRSGGDRLPRSNPATIEVRREHVRSPRPAPAGGTAATTTNRETTHAQAPHPDVGALAPTAPRRSATAPPTSSPRAPRRTLAADLCALVGRRPRAVAADRPDPVRDRRQPVPAVSQGRRDRRRRRRRAQAPRVTRASTARASPSAPRARACPARRRATASWSTCAAHWSGVTVEDGGRRLRVRPGTILSRANLALAPPAIAWDPTRQAPRAARRRRHRQQCERHVLRDDAELLPDAGVDHRHAAVGNADRHRGRRRRGASRRWPSRRSPADCSRSSARSRPTPSWSSGCAASSRIKNTTGYHMEAFLDGATPLEIFRRVLVGSEGTLAFIAEAVFDTIRDDQFRLTAFLIFPDMHAACAAVEPFVDDGAAAVELLRSRVAARGRGQARRPGALDGAAGPATGLLVEFRAADAAARSDAERAPTRSLAALPLLEPAEFTVDPALAAQYWNVRSGLLASVGGARPSGTSFILEDVCFPPERLADGALDLQALFARHGYAGVIFGHASAGNLHFLITPSLNEPAEVARFDAFMQDVVALVVDKYDGSLKAEHGTGRNIAPFVEREWGAKLTGADVAAEAARRSAGHPGAGRDAVERSRQPPRSTCTRRRRSRAAVDRCIECGFCERVCPSRNLTTTPRQRIALRRETVRQPAGSPVHAGAARRLRLRGRADLRRRRHVRARVSGGHQHRRADEALPPRRARRRRRGRRGDDRAAFPVGRAGRARRPSASPAQRPGSSAIGRCSAATGAPAAIVSQDLMPGWLPAMPAAARRTLPRDPARGRCRRLLHRVRQPHLRSRARARARPVARRGAGGGVAARAGCRCGFPTTSPATAARRSGTRRATRTATR